MKKLFLAFLIVFHLVILGHGQKIVTAQQVNGSWREVSSRADAVTTEFWIWALGHQKLKAEFVGNNAVKKFSNTATGTATIDGTVAVFKPDDADTGDPCIMTLHFTANRLIVTEKGNCGWGLGVDSEGTYRKVSSAKPPFDQ
jgi:hypothetical protein